MHSIIRTHIVHGRSWRYQTDHSTDETSFPTTVDVRPTVPRKDSIADSAAGAQEYGANRALWKECVLNQALRQINDLHTRCHWIGRPQPTVGEFQGRSRTASRNSTPSRSAADPARPSHVLAPCART